MEILDVVDENDVIVGSAPKKDIHEKGLPHRIAHVFVFNDRGDMALQLRSKNVKFCPQHWCTSAAGHIRSGESCEDGAIRECEEELGIRPKLHFAWKDYYENEKLKLFLYTYRTEHNGPFHMGPEEVERVEFFSLQQVRNMIASGAKFHPELMFLLKQHFGF